MAKHWVGHLVERIVNEKLSVAEATKLLLSEVGRGGRILVVDENLDSLIDELANRHYTVHGVRHGASDIEIKKELNNRVFITRNGKHFVKDQAKYRYGLVWVVSASPDSVLAQRVEKALSSGMGFKKNLIQTIKV